MKFNKLICYARHPSIATVCSIICVTSNAQQDIYKVLKGNYLGMKPPGKTAEVFAKGIISTELYEHSAPAFLPGGDLVLWGIVERGKPSSILQMERSIDGWTAPSAPSFADSQHDDMYPFSSPDGSKLFFSSRRPLPGGGSPGDIRIWVVDKTSQGWGQPYPLDTTITSGNEYAHSVSANGTLFYSARVVAGNRAKWSIFFSLMKNSKYQQPQELDSIINDGHYIDGPYISPDESYLVFESDRPGGIGSIDLYICFKQKNGKWGIPKNMGEKINSSAAERFAGVSPDGKYLFFGSNRNSELPDVYWIDASVIDDLR